MKRTIIPVRADQHAKHIIEQAAVLLGTTVSAFVLNYAYQAAKEVLNDTHLVLSNRDWQLFADAIEQPAKPNAKLKKLLS
jgi:uncharacterized protein (DUF1778 family)